MAQYAELQRAGAKEEKRERPLAAMRAPSLPALVPAISGGAWVKNSRTQTILFFLPKALEARETKGKMGL